jgi:serine/threonine protein kinase
VAVKTLTPDGLDRNVETVFQEASALDQIQHPAIVRLRECDFADSAQQRPYLVMDFFDGPTLEKYVRDHGPLPVEQFMLVARPTAEALRAFHARGILHRDVKPANLLVRRGTDGFVSENGWAVRLIDFGLALKQSMLAAAGTTARQGRSVAGASIAGTLDYAAPEQLGKILDARIGPAADVYGFGKTCCFALFGTPNPLAGHWRKVPEPLAELLEACLHEDPRQRLDDFGVVLQRLALVGEARVAAPTLPPPPIDLAADPVLQDIPEFDPRSRRESRVRYDEPEYRDRRRREEDDDREERQRRNGAARQERERDARARQRGKLPRMLSAALGMLFFCLTIGLGFILDSVGGMEPEKMPGMVFGMLIICVVIGGVGGAILRSVRAWIFVLVISAIVGVFTLSGPAMGRTVTKGGPLCDLCAGAGMGGLLAYILGIPLKFFLFLARLVNR